MMKFGDIAENIAVRVKPSESDSDIYVGLEHLDPETLHLKKWGHPSDVEGDKLRFWKGDIIFGRRRAYQRKLAIADFDGICSAHAIVLRAKTENIRPDFLPFFLQSDMFMERAIGISVGSLSPTINWKTLREEEFPLPPLQEQKRIAEILWEADETVERWNKAIHELRQLSVVLSVKKFLLHEARRQKPSLPQNWRIGTIDEIVYIDHRQPRDVANDLEVSFVAMEDVSEFRGLLNKSTKKFRDVKKGYTYFGEGDILFVKITPCMENNKGALVGNLTNGIGMGSTEFFVFRPKKKADQQFVYNLTMSRSYRKRAEGWMQGSAGQRRVPKDFFLKRPIVIPHEQERTQIGKIFKTIDERLIDAMQHLELIHSTRKKLLHEVFNEHGSHMSHELII